MALVRVGEVRPRLGVQSRAVALGGLLERGLETELERVGRAFLRGTRVGRHVRDERGGVAGIPRVTAEGGERRASHVVERSGGDVVVLGEDEHAVHDGPLSLCVLHGSRVLARGISTIRIGS